LDAGARLVRELEVVMALTLALFWINAELHRQNETLRATNGHYAAALRRWLGAA